VKEDSERDLLFRGVFNPEMAIENVIIDIDPVRQKKGKGRQGVQCNPGAYNRGPRLVFPGDDMFGTNPFESGHGGHANAADASSHMALFPHMGVGELPDGPGGVEGDEKASVCKGVFPGQGIYSPGEWVKERKIRIANAGVDPT
jgi:hypothetical protein